MKTAYTVNRESYSIRYNKGINRNDAERTCKEFDFGGCDDSETLATFDTLEQADAFAKEETKKVDMELYDKQAHGSAYYLDFNLIRVEEVELNDDGDLVSGGDVWKQYGATFEQLVDAMCSQIDNDNEEE